MEFGPRFHFYNGIRFSDLSWIVGLPELQNTLAARGLVYMTAFERDWLTYRGDVIAKSAKAAQAIASRRGLGESVTMRITKVSTSHRSGRVITAEPLGKSCEGPHGFDHGPFGSAQVTGPAAGISRRPQKDETKRFDPRAPICDGILYSDLWLIQSEEFQNVLASRGLVYGTEIDTPDGDPCSGDIIAKSRRAAEEIAFGRGLGERVVGRITGIGF